MIDFTWQAKYTTSTIGEYEIIKTFTSQTYLTHLESGFKDPGKLKIANLKHSLYQFIFVFCTARALIYRDQLSLFDIKLFFLEDFPFVKAATAQSIAFMPLGCFWPLELNNVSHSFCSRLFFSNNIPCRKPCLRLIGNGFFIQGTVQN
jgi:hypothetical protein